MATKHSAGSCRNANEGHGIGSISNDSGTSANNDITANPHQLSNTGTNTYPAALCNNNATC